jgi:hypothetical protein
MPCVSALRKKESVTYAKAIATPRAIAATSLDSEPTCPSGPPKKKQYPDQNRASKDRHPAKGAGTGEANKSEDDIVISVNGDEKDTSVAESKGAIWLQNKCHIGEALNGQHTFRQD